MEDLILLDTSVLIDYFRKKRRETSFFYQLASISNNFCISVITHYEISCGINLQQDSFWSSFFTDIINVPYNTSLNLTAVRVTKDLKKNRKSIEFKDLIIGSTALHHNYQLATINVKHFEYIDGLKLITPDSLL